MIILGLDLSLSSTGWNLITHENTVLGYDKICTQIRKAMDDLRILPKQTGDDDEDFNVGHIAELIEYYEPIPMTTKEFDDVNHIEEYIERKYNTKKKDYKK